MTETSRLPEELLASTTFLLARVGTAVKLRALEELEEAGYSMYQYGVLAILGEGARKTQATIADVLGVDRGQLVGVLDDLEERGLIERRRDPDDRRRHTVSLTSEGKRELVRLRGIVKRIEKAFFASLDDEAKNALHECLLSIAQTQDVRYDRAERLKSTHATSAPQA
jgi:DNA-binding MarR family transcriptional regulator